MNTGYLTRVFAAVACGALWSGRSLGPAGAFLLLALVLGCRTTPKIPGRAIGGAGDDFGYSVQPTLDGGYIIAGATSSFGATGKDVFLVKTNAAGDTIWSRRYGGAGDDEGNSVRQTSDGGYIIAGFTSSFGAGGYDIYLVRTNASGETLWTRTFGGTGEDKASSVLALSDGFIVAGWTFFASPQTYDAFLLRTDVAGNQLWMRTFGGTNDDKVTSVGLASDGGYLMAGFTASQGAGNYDLWLLRTDAAGETLWTRTFGGAQSDQGWSVAQTVDGGCVAAGYTNSQGGSVQVYLVKTDASGGDLWTRTCGSAPGSWALSVQPTADSGCILAGATGSSGAGGMDAYMVRTASSGDTLWTRTFGGAGDDRVFAVCRNADGGYTLVGSTTSLGAGGTDVYLVKTDGQGEAEE